MTDAFSNCGLIIEIKPGRDAHLAAGLLVEGGNTFTAKPAIFSIEMRFVSEGIGVASSRPVDSIFPNPELARQPSKRIYA